MLSFLWKRLSEVGPQVSGRALRRFPDTEVERLLRARVLIEHRRADTWSVCTHCDCGLDARPIRTVGDELRACCPYDPGGDEVLAGNDVRRFTIEPDRLASSIAASGGLTGGVSLVGEGIWLLGRTPADRAVVLCSDVDALDGAGTVFAIKAAAGGGAVLLVADEISTRTRLRMEEAGVSATPLADVIVADPTGRDRLDTERASARAPVASSTEAAPEARLQISRSRRAIRLDGRDIIFSTAAFDAVLGAAEKLVAGEVMLTYQELHSLTNRATHRDVINEIRDQLERHGLARPETFALIKTVHGRGIAIGLDRNEVDIRD